VTLKGLALSQRTGSATRYPNLGRVVSPQRTHRATPAVPTSVAVVRPLKKVIIHASEGLFATGEEVQVL
jgi:hypothetical protein